MLTAIIIVLVVAAICALIAGLEDFLAGRNTLGQYKTAAGFCLWLLGLAIHLGVS